VEVPAHFLVFGVSDAALVAAANGKYDTRGCEQKKRPSDGSHR